VYFNEKTLLDNDLDFWDTFFMKEVILIQNVKGFNQKKIFQKKQSVKNSFFFMGYVDFVDIEFDFYRNGTLLTEENCTRENFDRNMTGYFGDIRKIMLGENAFYGNKVCPYVFINTKLYQIIFNKITNSLIFKNRLEFMDIGKEEIDLGTNELTMYKMTLAFEEISLKNLNKHIFKK
jgi:hypothetical protein